MMKKVSILIGALTSVSVAAISSALPAMAQDAVPSAATEEDSSRKLGTVTVTARRVDESVQDVPLAITVIDETVLADSAISNIRDLQGFAPSLYLASGPGGPSAANVGIRGQTQADTLLTTDPSVAVYVDEISRPRQIGLRAALFDVGRIEVLKGPQGTLFGKNTTGGAVLVYSKRPDFEGVSGYVDSIVGNLNTVEVSGAVTLPVIADKMAIRVAGKSAQNDGIGQNALGQNLGETNDTAARVSMLWEPSSNIEWLATADWTESETTGSVINVVHVNDLAIDPDTLRLGNALNSVITATRVELGLPGTPEGITAAYNAFVDSAMNTGGFYESNGATPVSGHLELWGASSDLKVDVGSVVLRSITGYRDTSRNDVQDYAQTQFDLLRPNNFSYAGSFTQEFHIIDDVDDRLFWIVGAFYNYEDGREGSTTPQLTAINPNSPSMTAFSATNENLSIFAQAEYELTEQIRVTGGIRYSETEQEVISRNANGGGCVLPTELLDTPGTCRATFNTDAAQPSYLLSLDWQPHPDLLMYAKLASSFRAGGNNVRGSSDPVTFSPFEPEEATEYEIGFKSDLADGRLRVNAATFYTDYKNIQRSTTVSRNNNLATFVTNAAEGRVFGGEVEAWLVPTDNLALSGSLSYVDAAYDEWQDALLGDRTNEKFAIPDLQYSLTAKYTVPVGGNDLSIFGAWRWRDDVEFRSEAINTNTVTQEGFGLLEARISYDLDDYGLEISAFGKNMLDEEYYTGFLAFDTNLGYNIGYTGDPATYGLEVRYRFGAR
ncbi:TonB-dependent receptor [Hyphomonas sp.]|jgi:iron complex outermembrane receptor protein|uniref:TonB-dependent receptor n=2 Tax=Hyphomonas sp. TaxID=87 RepID=UPI003003393C